MFVREHTRYPVELAVRMKCATWADYLELHTSNLSRGGLFVPSPMTAPVGTELVIELGLPNGTTVKLRGEIAHVAAAEGDRPAGLGVMFMALEEPAKKALDDALRIAKANAPRPVAKPAPPPLPAKPAPPPPAVKAAPAAAETDARAPKFADAVEQALLDERARRLDLQPHDQLGVAIDAGDAEISEAHRQLKERYAPSIFARYGAATSQVVLDINAAVDAAYRRLLDPSQRRALVVAAKQPKPKELTPEELEQKRRGEEARNALRAGIERRIEEACAHRDMGRVDDAIRAFEAVLTLDRKHEYARAELGKLRDLKAKRKR